MPKAELGEHHYSRPANVGTRTDGRSTGGTRILELAILESLTCTVDFEKQRQTGETKEVERYGLEHAVDLDMLKGDISREHDGERCDGY